MPAQRFGTGLSVSAASCWCSTVRRSGAEQPGPRGWPKLPSVSPPPVPSWGLRGPAGSVALLRTLPSKVCTTSGRREGRSVSIPALGYPVRASERRYVPRWPTPAGKRRGASTRFSPTRAVVPGSFRPVASNRLTGSACRNSTVRDTSQFATDRHVTARLRAVARARRPHLLRTATSAGQVVLLLGVGSLMVVRLVSGSTTGRRGSPAVSVVRAGAGRGFRAGGGRPQPKAERGLIDSPTVKGADTVGSDSRTHDREANQRAPAGSSSRDTLSHRRFSPRAATSCGEQGAVNSASAAENTGAYGSASTRANSSRGAASSGRERGCDEHGPPPGPPPCCRRVLSGFGDSARWG